MQFAAARVEACHCQAKQSRLIAPTTPVTGLHASAVVGQQHTGCGATGAGWPGQVMSVHLPSDGASIGPNFSKFASPQHKQ